MQIIRNTRQQQFDIFYMWKSFIWVVKGEPPRSPNEVSCAALDKAKYIIFLFHWSSYLPLAPIDKTISVTFKGKIVRLATVGGRGDREEKR